jgi:FAD/FMN-containing dehydrogenase
VSGVSRISRREFLGSAGIAITAAGCGSGAHHRKPIGRPPVVRRPVLAPPPARLTEALRGHVITRGEPGFAAAAHVYNQRFDGIVPTAVARPIDTADVAAAVRWARARDVPLRARSGGHSYAGYSTVERGVVLDLRVIDHIRVDPGGRTVTIGAGAQLIDVYAALAAVGATIPAGSCPSVGVAGHALGGGMGLAGRAFGLTADNIVAAELVRADGTATCVDATTDPDLLWALRGGGGGNFGVVTELELRIHRVPSSASWFAISWPWSVAADALAAWQSWAPHAADELTSIFHLSTGASGPVVSVAGQYLGPGASLGTQLAPLTGVAGASLSSGQDDYLSLQLRWAGCLGMPRSSCHTEGTRPGGTLPRASFGAKSDFVSTALPGPARSALVAAIERRQGEPGSGAVLFDSYGGQLNRPAPSDTAFVHRDALCCMQYLTYDGGGAWLRDTYAAMRPYVSGMAYQNYIDPDLTDWRRAYYGANYARLVATRRRVDPEHYFSFPQAI